MSLYHVEDLEICLQCRRPWFDFWVRKICWRRDRLPTPVFLDFPYGLLGKESTCNVGDLGLIPGVGRSPGEGNSSPLQDSGLEDSTDCTVHGVAKVGTENLRICLSNRLPDDPDGLQTPFCVTLS